MATAFINGTAAFLFICIWFYLASIIGQKNGLLLAGAILFIPCTTFIGACRGFPIICKFYPVKRGRTKNSQRNNNSD